MQSYPHNKIQWNECIIVWKLRYQCCFIWDEDKNHVHIDNFAKTIEFSTSVKSISYCRIESVKYDFVLLFHFEWEQQQMYSTKWNWKYIKERKRDK